MKFTTLILALVFSLAAFAQKGKDPSASDAEGVGFMDVQKYPSMRPFLPEKFEKGDVLLEVNERRVKRVEELKEIFKDVKPGADVKYKVKHNGKVEETKQKVPGSEPGTRGDL